MTTTLSVEPVFDAATIEKEVRALAQHLNEDLGTVSEDVLVVSLLGGSVIFLADLVRAIHRPVHFEFLQVEQSGEGEENAPLHFYFPFPVEVKDKIVLLLKDVVSTGIIESYLCEQLSELGARDLRVAALVDLADERKTSFQPDYRVFTVERQGMLVGYGLKEGGVGGNLPYLGWLHDPS